MTSYEDELSYWLKEQDKNALRYEMEQIVSLGDRIRIFRDFIESLKDDTLMMIYDGSMVKDLFDSLTIQLSKLEDRIYQIQDQIGDQKSCLL